jgi:DNA-binding response OmpR family regulator
LSGAKDRLEGWDVCATLSPHGADGESGLLTGLLTGARVLIVEDEALIALAAEDALLEQGATVMGPVGRCTDAFALIDASQLDAAVLDVNLGSETSFPIAAALRNLGVPFVVTTGNSAAGAKMAAPMLSKPYSPEQLTSAVSDVLAHR